MTQTTNTEKFESLWIMLKSQYLDELISRERFESLKKQLEKRLGPLSL